MREEGWGCTALANRGGAALRRSAFPMVVPRLKQIHSLQEDIPDGGTREVGGTRGREGEEGGSGGGVGGGGGGGGGGENEMQIARAASVVSVCSASPLLLQDVDDK